MPIKRYFFKLSCLSEGPWLTLYMHIPWCAMTAWQLKYRSIPIDYLSDIFHTLRAGRPFCVRWFEASWVKGTLWRSKKQPCRSFCSGHVKYASYYLFQVSRNLHQMSSSDNKISRNAFYVVYVNRRLKIAPLFTTCHRSHLCTCIWPTDGDQ